MRDEDRIELSIVLRLDVNALVVDSSFSSMISIVVCLESWTLMISVVCHNFGRVFQILSHNQTDA